MISAWSTEGGIRCPSIIAYPGFGNDANGVIKHEMTTVMDILPTLVSDLLSTRVPSLIAQLDLAGVKPPGSLFRGRQVLEPRGKSWVKWLSGADPEVHDDNAVHGWERKYMKQ
jgi:arylsulfatase A-like enzyme